MRILIATVQIPFATGGAEVLVEDLRRALVEFGHEVDVVALPWGWTGSDSFMDHLAAFRLLDLTHSQGAPIDRLVAMKFPAYLIPHPNKVVWLMHQQRQAYELWDDQLGLSQVAGGRQIRDLIYQADQLGLQEARKIFTISETVTRRLKSSLSIPSTPLPPPPRNAERLYTAKAEDYLFFPSRLSPWKRQRLVLEALALTEENVRIRFAGFREDSPELKPLELQATELGVQDRVEWLGLLSEKDYLECFARSLAVLFPPYDEDYGYITVEAMLASKPVITCTDSGGPLEWVLNDATGWVTEPRPSALADVFDQVWRQRDKAEELGINGRDRWHRLSVSWHEIADRLLQ